MRKIALVRQVKMDHYKFSKENIGKDFYCNLMRELSKYADVEVLIQDRDISKEENIVEDNNFVIKRVPDFSTYKKDFYLIWTRGNYPDYNLILDNHPEAIKAYYRAGYSLWPIYKKYDIFFTLNNFQNSDMEKKYGNNVKCYQMLKSADHTIWKPLGLKKEYDAIHVANLDRPVKNHKLFFDAVRELKIKAVCVGNRCEETEKMADGLDVKFTGHIPYEKVNEYINKSKISVICTDKTDGPRTNQECLAAGIPMVAHSDEPSSTVYINEHTGLLSNGNYFANAMKKLIDTYDKYDTRSYFLDHLKMDIVSKYFVDIFGL